MRPRFNTHQAGCLWVLTEQGKKKEEEENKRESRTGLNFPL